MGTAAAAPTPTSSVAPALAVAGNTKVLSVHDLGQPVDRQESNVDRRKAHIAIPTGGTIGSDQYWVRNPSVRPRTYLVSALAVVILLCCVVVNVSAESLSPRWRNRALPAFAYILSLRSTLLVLNL
jgi:hypothetical protein